MTAKSERIEQPPWLLVCSDLTCDCDANHRRPACADNGVTDAAQLLWGAREGATRPGRPILQPVCANAGNPAPDQRLVLAPMPAQQQQGRQLGVPQFERANSEMDSLHGPQARIARRALPARAEMVTWQRAVPPNMIQAAPCWPAAAESRQGASRAQAKKPKGPGQPDEHALPRRALYGWGRGHPPREDGRICGSLRGRRRCFAGAQERVRTASGPIVGCAGQCAGHAVNDVRGAKAIANLGLERDQADAGRCLWRQPCTRKSEVAGGGVHQKAPHRQGIRHNGATRGFT
ncbi:hypothetical protein FQR65_LT20183 [Abscondita terminalis]|nr:hypothetical protein FQR65_LT20183 [Abscondita terminalis]